MIYNNPGIWDSIFEIWTTPANLLCRLPIPWVLVTGETAEKPQAQTSVDKVEELPDVSR